MRPLPIFRIAVGTEGPDFFIMDWKLLRTRIEAKISNYSWRMTKAIDLYNCNFMTFGLQLRLSANVES